MEQVDKIRGAVRRDSAAHDLAHGHMIARCLAHDIRQIERPHLPDDSVLDLWCLFVDRGERLSQIGWRRDRMLSPYKQYKAHVAPIYQSEIDRHLFATASFRDRRRSRRRRRPWREWLRLRRLGLWGRWGNPEASS